MAAVKEGRVSLSGASSSSMSEVGQIELILGPMFAGKSTELLRRTRRFAQYKKCLLVAYKGDERYSADAAVITHDRSEMKAKSVERLSQVENAAHAYSVIGIDEGQFFPGPFKSLSGSSIQICSHFDDVVQKWYQRRTVFVCLVMLTFGNGSASEGSYHCSQIS